MEKLHSIPTNIITGALGVGKTTLIQSLLEHKPVDERWAVLVNEFGEVGIDGAMFAGAQGGTARDIFVKEVPGGCMCCTSGLPMQIALNMLLAKARPHRLLIEPTGLGHPKEVLQTLTAPHYREVLDVQATLTLLDARKLSEPKWRSHPTFREQMQIADTVILTKADLYTTDYQSELLAYFKDLKIASTPIVKAQKGHIDMSLLAQPSRFAEVVHEPEHQHHHDDASLPQTGLVAPEQGCLRINNRGDGYYSRGWLCAAEQVFDYNTCMNLFLSLPVERLKAVVRTDKGPVSFNITDGVVRATDLSEAQDTRIELIVDSEIAADRFAERIETELGLKSMLKLVDCAVS